MFGNKAGAYPVGYLTGDPLSSRLLALPTNNMLGREVLDRNKYSSLLGSLKIYGFKIRFITLVLVYVFNCFIKQIHLYTKNSAIP